MIDQSLQNEAWQRLIAGQSLSQLSLPTRGERIDLSGLRLPEPQIIRQFRTSVADVTEITPNGEFRDVRWSNLDFTNSNLPSLRFWNSEIINCCFDGCRMTDLLPFGTTFRNCSFRKADLRRSGLGAPLQTGPSGYRRNIFAGVDFTEADLRQTIYIAAGFERCVFRNTKLVKIDFGNSTFTDCQFEGELREVQFWRSNLFLRPELPADAFPPNEMLNADFSRAKLRNVEFRGIDLSNVRLPNDADHIIVQNYGITLDKLIEALRKDGDRTAMILIAAFEIDRKWAVPGSPGVLNKHDLAEAGDDAVERVMKLLKEFKSVVQ